MFSAELANQPPIEKTPPPPRERDPLKLDQEIEAQREFFLRRLGYFESALLNTPPTPESLHKMAEKAIDTSQGKTEFAAAADFFALASVVEKIRTGNRHQPTWEQAAAATHIVFPYRSNEAQRIQMATGEGKTFTIAIAALWKALHGESVSIYTDKKANVEQSYEKTKPLYASFGVESAKVLNVKDPDALLEYYKEQCKKNKWKQVLTIDQPGSLYLFYLQNPPVEVRIDTMASFVHEALTRQQMIFRGEALLRGDTANQRAGLTVLSEAQQNSVRANIETQKAWMRSNCDILDEGDLSLDMEDSPIVLAEKDPNGFSEVEAGEFELSWELFADQKPAENGAPGTLDRITAAVGYSQADVRNAYEVVPTYQVEGMQIEGDDIRQRITTENVSFMPEVFYPAKLLEASVTPKLLVDSLQLLQLQYQEGEVADLPVPVEVVKELAEFARSVGANPDALINWSEVEDILPPLTKKGLRGFLGLDNSLHTNGFFDHRKTLSQHAELQGLVANQDVELNAGDWKVLEAAFGGEFQLLMQQIALFQVMELVKLVWEPLFIRFNHDIFNVKYLMKEGNEYQLSGDGDDREAVVLGPDRQPQPGKEFQDNTQVFIHLKHGIPLPGAQKTTAQILPQTWFSMSSREGTEITSLSGSQDKDKVDYLVRSTGENKVEVLPTRVLGNKEQKLRAIVDYVSDRGDVPILLCVQDADELKKLQDSLKDLPGRTLDLLDARHADESNEKVPNLKAGNILILQITARGLDFGHFLENGQHSFENGLIVSASPLPDLHQQLQMEGRLGGKRANGFVVTYSDLGDEVAQQFYKISPELSRERHEKMDELEAAFTSLVASMDRSVTWPQSLSEAMVALENWRDDEPMPPWMQLFNEGKFAGLQRRYSALREGHIQTLERQQNNNLTEMYENRREQMVIDVVVQNLWREIMNPTESTPVGRAVLPLTFEERQAIMERIFAEANQLYPLAIQALKPDTLASHFTEERNKMATFMKELGEYVVTWVELETLERQYDDTLALVEAQNLTYDLPAKVQELPAWLESHPEPKQPRRTMMEKISRLAFFGRGMQPPEPRNASEVLPQTDNDVMLSLRVMAQKERQIRRKLEAII